MYFSNLLINFNLFPVVVWVHTTSIVCLYAYLCACVCLCHRNCNKLNWRTQRAATHLLVFITFSNIHTYIRVYVPMCVFEL